MTFLFIGYLFLPEHDWRDLNSGALDLASFMIHLPGVLRLPHPTHSGRSHRGRIFCLRLKRLQQSGLLLILIRKLRGGGAKVCRLNTSPIIECGLLSSVSVGSELIGSLPSVLMRPAKLVTLVG